MTGESNEWSLPGGNIVLKVNLLDVSLLHTVLIIAGTI